MKRLKITIFFCTLVTMLMALLIRTGWVGAAGAALALASGSSCGSWSIVSSPSPGAGNDNLMSVATTSVSDAWAVGSDTTNNVYQTLTEHWDGSHWSTVS